MHISQIWTVVIWQGQNFEDGLKRLILVGGFNPSEKYDRQIGFIFPKVRGENKKYSKHHHLA